MPTAGSANGLSTRDLYVLCRIDVPVMGRPAPETLPFPDRQIQLAAPLSTAGTGLARRLPPIHHPDCPAIPDLICPA